MKSINYVAMTFGVLGSIPIYGFIFTIPAVFLCRKANKLYEIEHGKAHGLTVVLLTLNWILLGLYALFALFALIMLLGQAYAPRA
jgi:hypothetical protein